MSTSAAKRPRFTVDPWDPAYGASADGTDLDPTGADVDLNVESTAGTWAPVPAPSPEPASSPASGHRDPVVLVDGVRRVEARVWLDDGDGGVVPGLCASYAAGVVVCNGTARVGAVEVGRVLCTSLASAAPIVTRCGSFDVALARSVAVEHLSLALQDRMGLAEVRAASAAAGEVAASSPPASAPPLIIVDGPLRGRAHLPGAVGYIKTHHVSYLPADQQPIVHALQSGERTPVFMVAGAFSRYSWYLRLPGANGGPWSGVVRCEAPSDLSPAAAIALAERTAALLPALASQRHKDPRAPQNLVPIGGLERELRHRLGDPHVIFRGLAAAAHA